MFYLQPNLLSWSPLLSNNLYYVTVILISFHSAFYINITCIKWPPVLCDPFSMFPWKVTLDRFDCVRVFLLWQYTIMQNILHQGHVKVHIFWVWQYCLGPLVFLFPKTFKLFGFLIFWLWVLVYLMNGYSNLLTLSTSVPDEWLFQKSVINNKQDIYIFIRSNSLKKKSAMSLPLKAYQKLLSDWLIYSTFLHMIGQLKMNESLQDMTPNGTLLDVRVSSKKKIRRYKDVILIRFLFYNLQSRGCNILQCQTSHLPH